LGGGNASSAGVKTGATLRRTNKATKAPAKTAGRRVSFATAAEKFRGMLKNGPHDLSIREGLRR
jgi:hypothetical protein